MCDFFDKQPEEIIRSDCLQDYQLRRSVLCDELTYLHANVSLLGQIRDFDAQLFGAPTAFLQYLVYLLSTNSVLTVQRIWRDKPKRSLTLDRFLTWIVDKAVVEEFSKPLDDKIQGALPSAELEKAISAMRDIRHASIAHVDKHVHLGLTTPPEPVSYDDIAQAAQSLAGLFNLVSFGSHQLFVPIQFYASEGQWHEGEFGYVLERVALGSHWCSGALPADFIRRKMAELSPEQVSQIERLRKKYRFQTG